MSLAKSHQIDKYERQTKQAKENEQKGKTLFCLLSWSNISVTVLPATLKAYGLEKHRLVRECCDDLFIAIAEDMRSCHKVAPYLGIADEDVDDIARDQDGDETSRKIALLQHWKRRKGYEGTYLALVQAFLSMNDRLMAENIVRHTKESKSCNTVHYVPNTSYI